MDFVRVIGLALAMLHRYTGKYCLFLGYYTLFFMIVWEDNLRELMFKYLFAYAWIMFVVILIIAIIIDEEAESRIFEYFGFWR